MAAGVREQRWQVVIFGVGHTAHAGQVSRRSMTFMWNWSQRVIVDLWKSSSLGYSPPFDLVSAALAQV
jgi:hypothetical protein